MDEPNAEDQDVRLSERDALPLGARLEVSDAERMGRPRVVGQPRATADSGVVLDEIEEDAASTDAVVRPVYKGRKSRVSVSRRACEGDPTVNSELEAGMANLGRVVDLYLTL